MAQGLGLCASTAGSMGATPGQETKIFQQQQQKQWFGGASQPGQRLEGRILEGRDG